MKTYPNNFASASARQITFSIAVVLAFAVLLASAALATPILGNYPDTTLALSTDTTVTPDAAPTDTVSMNVSTSTDFNGTLTGDPTTGVVRVTNAHPTGTYIVTVTAFDSGGATAIKTFTLTVTTPLACDSVSFAAATKRLGFQPHSVAVGDFNGDGKQDLTATGEHVSVLLGDGAGNFSAPTIFSAGANPWSVTVGDFNGDGKQDLAAANFTTPGTISIFLGDGAGNFSAPTNFAVGDYPRSVAVGDFNGDGKQDLAAGNQYSNSVSILLGDGTGNFSAPSDSFGVVYPYSIAVGDFNSDRRQDLAVVGIYSSNVFVLSGDGAGNFSAPTKFATADRPESVAVGDFNGDGRQDLATANDWSDNVSILLGDGAGNFSAPTNFAADSWPDSVVVADLNGDGEQDLVVGNVNSNASVSVLVGDGAGNFSAPTNIPVDDYPVSAAVGDFNGDGRQDLAVANSFSSSVSIMLRDCPASQITSKGTTCSQFSSGTAETLDRVQYTVNDDLIDRVSPGGFRYWVSVTAVSGSNTFKVTQTITTGDFSTFFTANKNGIRVFDSDCVSLERSARQNGHTVTVRFSAPSAGTYYIGINFDADSLVGAPAPNPETVHYDFATTGVPNSTSGLDLVKH